MKTWTRDSLSPVMITFLILSLSVLISVSVQAIPPTPPMQLQLPAVEELATLQPEKGAFTVPARIRAQREVSKLTLVVRTTKGEVWGQSLNSE